MLTFPELKGSADQVRLVLDRAEFVGEAGKAEDINGAVVGAKKIEAAAHRAPGSDKFKIEHGSGHTAAEILALAGDIARKELQLLFFAADHFGKLCIFLRRSVCEFRGGRRFYRRKRIRRSGSWLTALPSSSISFLAGRIHNQNSDR